MPLKYQYTVQERLKKYIYTGEVQKFKNLFDFIKDKDPERAKKYLEGTHDEGRSLLSWAALERDGVEIMSYLIEEQGANVDHQDGKKRTPLSNAVDRGHEANVTYLLSKKAKPDLPDMNDDTCLHVAAKGRSEGVIKQLLDAGANITAENNLGATPIHTAARYSLDALHAFVKYREADVKTFINKPDNNGDTPLHYAAQDETGHNATYLLLLGANKTLKNNSKETPTQVANYWEPDGKAVHAILEFTKKAVVDVTPEGFFEGVKHSEEGMLTGEAFDFKVVLVGKGGEDHDGHE
jgi:ankyrin repeat protein